jgi:hypothetical protein
LFETVMGIANLSPAYISAGSSGIAVTVNGLGFSPGSTVYLGATALATQYLSPTQLVAQVTSSEIASAGIATISVQPPSPGGSSNGFQFEIDTPGSTPAIFATNSATVFPGSPATFSVSLPFGASAVSINCLNLPPGAACSYSSTSGSVTVTTASFTLPGTYAVTTVFSESLPGATPAWIVYPILLLPILFARRRMAARGIWISVCLAVALGAAMSLASGCGGSGSSNNTHEATSSGVFYLTVQ